MGWAEPWIRALRAFIIDTWASRSFAGFQISWADSGFQSPGLRVPQAKFHRSGILITYHGAPNFEVFLWHSLNDTLHNFKFKSTFQLKKILIKCCDISNEVRPIDVSEPWADCLLEEYFMQVWTNERNFFWFFVKCLCSIRWLYWPGRVAFIILFLPQ